MKSIENSFIMLTIIPTNTVRAAFSKSVNQISSGLNSTLQPISLSVDGGLLNRNEFQFVDYKFSKCDTSLDGGTFVHHSVFTPSYYCNSALQSTSSLLPHGLFGISSQKFSSFSYAGTGDLQKSAPIWLTSLYECIFSLSIYFAV